MKINDRLARLIHLPALGLYILLTIAMTWPYARQIQTSLYNWSDALLNTWTLAWGTHALLTDPLHLYNADIFYPYANTLAYSESLLPQTALAMPIILSTNMPAFAHNLLVLSSFVLSAFGMYLLAYDLTRGRAAGLVAGVIYAFTSYKMMHLPHLQLLSSQWMPFALLYLHKLLTPTSSSSRMAHKLRQVFLFAIFFALQALSSFYYAFFIAIAAGLYAAYIFFLRMWRRATASDRRESLWEVAPTLAALVLIAVLTIPPSLPYFSVQRDLGLERGTGDVEYYAATLRTYFSVPDNNWLYARWLAPKARMTGSGERDFVGFVALGLAVIGLIAFRRDKEKWFYVLLGGVALILSFGARNEILLFPRVPKISLPFYLPYRYLFLAVPGFKAMRGPDRFAYLAVLALAVLAAFGTRAVMEKIRAARPSWMSGAFALACVGLIAAENIAVPIRLTNPATLARPLPETTSFIAESEPDAVVLELPMQYQKEFLAWPQYYSLFHWHHLVNGFSGFFPPGFDALVSLTREFPSEASLALLDEIGVRYVVVHNDLLTASERAGVIARMAAFDGHITRVRQFGTDDVYQLTDAARGWGTSLAQIIPNGAQVRLNNAREDRRELFEIAAAFLPEREFSGNANAAYRALAPLNSSADFVIANADDAPPPNFARRVWANNYLVIYAR